MTTETRSRGTGSARRSAATPAPYTEHDVHAGALKLHYLDYGTQGKPHMLCIHGGAAHSHWFDYIAPGFTPDYHVRSLDLRGHGDSGNAGSIALHRRLGFEMTGTFRSVGFKFGRWVDSVLMQRALGSGDSTLPG